MQCTRVQTYNPNYLGDQGRKIVNLRLTWVFVCVCVCTYKPLLEGKQKRLEILRPYHCLYFLYV